MKSIRAVIDCVLCFLPHKQFSIIDDAVFTGENKRSCSRDSKTGSDPAQSVRIS